MSSMIARRNQAVKSLEQTNHALKSYRHRYLDYSTREARAREHPDYHILRKYMSSSQVVGYIVPSSTTESEWPGESPDDFINTLIGEAYAAQTEQDIQDVLAKAQARLQEMQEFARS